LPVHPPALSINNRLCCRRANGRCQPLEATVRGFEVCAERLELDITVGKKRAKELGEKVGAKFEREDRFQELTRRQSEIEENLDLLRRVGRVGNRTC
jgi:hypothetical protein